MEGSELLHTFERELRHGTEQMQSLLLEIEQKGGFEESLPLLQECYRLAHSLKGASRVVGLFPIEEMAHAMEDGLQEMLRAERKPTPRETSVLLKAVDGFNTAFQAFLNGEMFDPAPLVEEMKSAAREKSAASPAAAPEPATETDAVPEPPPQTKEERSFKREEQVMIASRQVDDLFRRVEEAFLIESRLRSLLTEADSGLRESRPEEMTSLWQKHAGPLKNEISRLHFVLMQFHDIVRVFRMIPMSRLRVSAQKSVRELSHSLGKPVSFHFHGAHQLVDSSLLEALQEPVLHLLRNAVDHGIEAAAKRREMGKPEEGRITVDARVSGGFLTLTLTDDGRGINHEDFRRRALELQMVTADGAGTLSEKDWLEFMFRPGFSTASEVSAISGRGLGMDIVRRRIQDLGGHLELSTRVGTGTTFSIQVPIGLLTPRVLVVRCGAHLAAIPTSEIERVFSYDPAQAKDVNGKIIVTWNRTPVPVDSLAGHLGWESGSGAGHVVLLQRQNLRKGVLVDEVLSEVEQVAFPPPWNLRGIPYLSGVIVMGSGTLVPVIETHDLMQNAGATAAAGVAPSVAAVAARSVLVVDDSPTILALHRSILKNAGYNVSTAENGLSAWNAMQSREIDLLLTDIEMPGMNGLDLIRKIRGSAKWKHLPIIVISQYGSQEDLKKGAQAGADRYIVKSAFQPQQLLEMVQELLLE